MVGLESGGKWSGLLHRGSMFYRVLTIMLALMLVTALLFGSFLSYVIGTRSRQQVVQLQMAGLSQTGEQLKLVLDVLSMAMTQSLWSQEFLAVLIDPYGVNAERQSGVVRQLKNQALNHALVEVAYLYASFSNLLYSSEEKYSSLEASGLQETVTQMDAALQEQPLPNMEWRIFTDAGGIYLACTMNTPILVGIMFYRLDAQVLYATIADGSSLAIFNEQKERILPQDNTEQWPEQVPDPQDSTWLTVTAQTPGWTYVTKSREDAVSLDIQDIRNLILGVFAVYFFVSICFSIYISKTAYRPISELMRIAKARSAAPADGPPGTATDETQYLQQQYQHIFDQNEEYSVLLDQVSDDILEQLLRACIMGQYPESHTPERVLEGLAHTQWASGTYVLETLRIDAPGAPSDSAGVELGLYQRYLLNLVNHLADGQEKKGIYLGPNLLAIVFLFPANRSLIQVHQGLQQWDAKLRAQVKHLPFQLTMFHGPVCHTLHELSDSNPIALDPSSSGVGPEEGSTHNASPVQRYKTEQIRHLFDLASHDQEKEAIQFLNLLVEELFRQTEQPERLRNTCRFLVDAMVEQMVSAQTGHDWNTAAKKLHIPPLSASSPAQLQQELQGFLGEAVHQVAMVSRKRQYHHIHLAKQYLEEHYQNGALSLDQVSEYTGIHPSYLSTLFKEIEQKSFSTYLNELRIGHAKQLLDGSDLEIWEIGHQCGFNSPQSFSRAFRNFEGSTPSQYRKNAKHRGD